jgi:DNA-binding response OmpR family regulator
MTKRAESEERVLWILVEDWDLRNLISHLAGKAGFRTVIFPSLGEAWEAVRRPETLLEARPPDQVICERSVADGECERLFAAIRARYVSVNIDCIAAVKCEESEVRMRENGVRPIERPASLADVYQLIASWRYAPN